MGKTKSSLSERSVVVVVSPLVSLMVVQVSRSITLKRICSLITSCANTAFTLDEGLPQQSVRLPWPKNHLDPLPLEYFGKAGIPRSR